MSSILEDLKAQRIKYEEAINNVLEAGQEFQTRNGRVKQANLKTLQDKLESIEMQIRAIEGEKNSGFTDRELYVFRGCR